MGPPRIVYSPWSVGPRIKTPLRPYLGQGGKKRWLRMRPVVRRNRLCVLLLVWSMTWRAPMCCRRLPMMGLELGMCQRFDTCGEVSLGGISL